MKVVSGTLEFEWDKGNSEKNFIKHGVGAKEAESVFVDLRATVFPDVRHNETEDRFVILGNSEEDRKLFIIFTLRRNKIRIISARRMHQKEVEKYEKTKKGT